MPQTDVDSLPLYRPDEKYEYYVDRPSQLEEVVRSARLFLQPKIDKLCHIYNTGRAHTNETLIYIRDKDHIFSRIGVMAGAGVLGLLAGRNGSLAKKMATTSLAISGFSVICYPDETKMLAGQSSRAVTKGAHVVYNFVIGARPAAKNQDGNAFEKITKLFERKPKQEEPAKAEPIVEKAKPVAEKVELVKTEPIVERAEPVVEKAEPVIEKVEPVIEKAEPVVEEAESPKVEPVMEEPAAEMESPEPEPVQEKPSAEVEPAKVEPVTEQVAVEVEPLVELESPKVESVEEEPAAEVESPKAEHATEGQAPQEESEAGVKLLAQDTTTEVQPEPEKALKALLEGDLGQGHEEDQDLYTTRG